MQDVTTHGDKRWRSLCGHKVNAEAAMLDKPFLLSHSERGAASVPCKNSREEGRLQVQRRRVRFVQYKQLQIMHNLVWGKPPNN